jgi:hypothetical protein
MVEQGRQAGAGDHRRRGGNDIVLSSGVKAGQTVVTAGVNLLKPGQKVKDPR